jgi:hypothetical protein
MDGSVVTLIGMAALLFATLAAVTLYRWRQRKRVRHVAGRVKEYLSARYGELPGHLNINCSDDLLWPVLVAFDSPRTGVRHRLQFDWRGPAADLVLLSEQEDGP